jgi:hypothetical protein
MTGAGSDGPPGGARDIIAALVEDAERSYSAMYDARSPNEAACHYSDAKEALYSAIGRAREAGLDQLASELFERLAHIKAVFRSQFT